MVRPFALPLTALAAILCSAFALSGCATVMDGATEDITIQLVGADQAVCDVTQPGRRYRVFAPGSFRAMKSPNDLRIDCAAPGNRHKVETLKATLEEDAAYNVANAGLGVVWDYMSGAAHQYPSTVLMDFSSIPPTPYPPPTYQAVLSQHPELTGMEQFNPGVSALQSDQGQPMPALHLRSTDDPAASSEIMAPVSGSTTGSTPTAPAPAALPPVKAPTVPGSPPPAPPPGAPPASPFSALGASGTGSPLKIFSDKIGTVPPVSH